MYACTRRRNPGRRASMMAVLCSLSLILGGGCATTPVLSPAGSDPLLTPALAVTRIEAAVGRTVLWGGGIIASRNHATGTQLEVMAYPLRASQRPDDRAEPLGRFLVEWPAYLETLDYREGRRITLRGRLVGVRSERLGQATYAYPVVAAEALHLWPPEPPPGAWPIRFHFGFFFSN